MEEEADRVRSGSGSVGRPPEFDHDAEKKAHIRGDRPLAVGDEGMRRGPLCDEVRAVVADVSASVGDGALPRNTAMGAQPVVVAAPPAGSPAGSAPAPYIAAITGMASTVAALAPLAGAAARLQPMMIVFWATGSWTMNVA